MAGELRTYTRVQSRNAIGRFAKECEIARESTLKKAGAIGLRTSQSLAPKKTGRLAASLKLIVTGGTATWGSNLAYAASQEGGARRHPIVAVNKRNLNFWWEKKGVRFVGPSVDHPGVPGVHYLRGGYQAATAVIMQIARQEYPG